MRRHKKLIGLTLVIVALAAGVCWGYVQYHQKQLARQQQVDPLKQQISEMTLDEKLGQLFVAKTSGVSADQVEKNVSRYHLGGLLISSDAYYDTTKKDFKQQLKDYQKQADIPLGLAADQEGGTVSRLDINPDLTDTKHFPSPMALYKQGGLANNVKWAKLTAQELKALGFNWDFAPVADVATDPNSFIYERTLGQNYQKTATYIAKVVPAMQNEGVATAVKHFPGYGNVGDTHNDGAHTKRTKQQILAEDAVPFKAAIKAKTASIMMTHVVFDNIDADKPASISKKDVDLLRHDLNYQGVIMTDSMQMGAITQYVKKHHQDASVAALEAGNDVILSNDFKKGIPAIKKAIKQGKISEKQVDQSVYRILKMKQNHFQ